MIRDLEPWHNRTRTLLRFAESNTTFLKLLELIIVGRRFTDKRLRTSIGGIMLDNPVMVAAGFDKEAKVVRALWKLGFSGIEIGSVVTYPQPGNPKPRHFSLAPGVTLNRYGFNSSGMEIVAENLKRYKNNKIPIGINIGKNKNIPNDAAPHMYATISALVTERLYSIASYFVVNVSSPNTQNLHRLQERKSLLEVVQTVQRTLVSKGKKKPLFIKITPDLNFKEVDDIIDIVLSNKIAGIIAANTSINKKWKRKYGRRWEKELGGLGGNDADYRRKVNKIIRYIYRQTKGKIDIIGVGGVNDTFTALEKLQAGARAVQIMSAIQTRGLTIAKNINRGLAEWMDREGVKSINDIVGSAV